MFYDKLAYRQAGAVLRANFLKFGWTDQARQENFLKELFEPRPK